jgi:hypothetical protein
LRRRLGSIGGGDVAGADADYDLRDITRPAERDPVQAAAALAWAERRRIAKKRLRKKAEEAAMQSCRSVVETPFLSTI